MHASCRFDPTQLHRLEVRQLLWYLQKQDARKFYHSLHLLTLANQKFRLLSSPDSAIDRPKQCVWQTKFAQRNLASGFPRFVAPNTESCLYKIHVFQIENRLYIFVENHSLPDGTWISAWNFCHWSVGFQANYNPALYHRVYAPTQPSDHIQK